MGSSSCEPIGNAKNHSPKASSDPVTLMAGTRNRSFRASPMATALSPMCGPKIARHPSSTNSA